MDLRAEAQRVMVEHGFDLDVPPAVPRQLSDLAHHPPAVVATPEIRDLRHLAWSSIDNDTSRDLDQLEVAKRQPDGAINVQVAIADVDAFVEQASPIDQLAARQTTTVYTGVRNFPMLPEQLSTAATSLQEGADKLAVVIDFVVAATGHVQASAVYRAIVRNTAQLTYGAVGAWLEQRAPAPGKVASSAVLQEQLQLQDLAAQALRNERHRHGALNIETIETRPVLLNDQVTSLEQQEKNRATELIEDFMIASNEIVARLLDDVPSIRRVVKTPKRWDRIVAVAAAAGGRLPAVPDSKALNEFLVAQKAADPDHFADLSLAVIKLMGPGEYAVERPGDPDQGHFGLAVEDYTHSTAPNRRFADLVTQRLVKAVIRRQPAPYGEADLEAVAARCTERADAARKVEREMSKRIAAVAMSSRVGEAFDAIVTGVTPRGTFVRVLRPHVEGLLVHSQPGTDVGDRVRVTLVRTESVPGVHRLRPRSGVARPAQNGYHSVPLNFPGGQVMKLVIAVALVVVASLAIAPTASLAAQAKTKSTGVVTAVTTDSVTVKVAGKDMAFKIDDKTSVIAKGAGTAAKEAKKEGMKGPKLGDVVKVGDEVEVTHSTVAGTMVANDVRVTKKAATK